MAKTEYNFDNNSGPFYQGYQPQKAYPTGMDAFNQQDERLNRQRLAEEEIAAKKKAREEALKKANKVDYTPLEEAFSTYEGRVTGTAYRLRDNMSKQRLANYNKVLNGEMSEAEWEEQNAMQLNTVKAWNEMGTAAIEEADRLSKLDPELYDTEKLNSAVKRVTDFLRISNSADVTSDGKLVYFREDENGKKVKMTEQEFNELATPIDVSEMFQDPILKVDEKVKGADLTQLGVWDGDNFVWNGGLRPEEAEAQGIEWELNNWIMQDSESYYSAGTRRSYNTYLSTNANTAAKVDLDSMAPEDRKAYLSEQAIMADRKNNERIYHIYRKRFEEQAKKLEKERRDNGGGDTTTYKPITKYSITNGWKTAPVSARSGPQGNPIETVTGQRVLMIDGKPQFDDNGYYKVASAEIEELKGQVKRPFIKDGQIVFQMAAPTQMDINELMEQKDADREAAGLPAYSADEKKKIRDGAIKEMLGGAKSEGFFVSVDLQEAENMAAQIEGLDLLLKDWSDQRVDAGNQNKEPEPRQETQGDVENTPQDGGQDNEFSDYNDDVASVANAKKSSLSSKEREILNKYNTDERFSILYNMNNNPGFTMEQIIDDLGLILK